MTVFKVGDRIRCIAEPESGIGHWFGVVGHEYIVSAANSLGGGLNVRHDSLHPNDRGKQTYGFSSCRFELVKQGDTKQPEVGDTVEILYTGVVKSYSPSYLTLVDGHSHSLDRNIKVKVTKKAEKPFAVGAKVVPRFDRDNAGEVRYLFDDKLRMIVKIGGEEKIRPTSDYIVI